MTLRDKILNTITCPHGRKWKTAGELTDRIISALMDEAKFKCVVGKDCPLVVLRRTE